VLPLLRHQLKFTAFNNTIFIDSENGLHSRPFPSFSLFSLDLICFTYRFRERVVRNGDEPDPTADYCIKLHVGEQPGHSSVTDGLNKPLLSARNFLKSESIGASQCVVIKEKREKDEESMSEYMNEAADGVPHKIAQLKT
jgi:hypothetical protein